MSAIRIVRGVYRNKTVQNQVFTLVSGFQTGAKGGYVTVQNDGTFPNCPDSIRVKVENISDIEYISGETVQENTVKFKPTVVAETDEQAMDRIRERFDILHEMTKACVSGDIRAMIVSGPPGVGKSYGVEQEIDKACLFDKLASKRLKAEVVKGSASPIGLYKTLYKYSDANCVLVFDDCDSVLLDDLSLNILKAALDSSKKRMIHWNTDSRLLRSEGVPNSFEFKGGAIFITNIKFDNVRSKKLRDHLEALESRCHYLDLTIDTEREKILRIEQVVAECGMLDKYEFEPWQAMEVVEFVKSNTHRLRELSLRTVLKVADLKHGFPDKWRAVAEVTCMRNSR